MNNLQQLKRMCLEEVERAYSIVEDKYSVIIPRVPVTFSNSMTKTGGTARFRNNRLTGELTPIEIRLSLPLLKLNGERYVMDTPGHEAMHIATYAMWNYAGHGPKWTGLMRLIGRSTSRCHTMDVVKSRTVKAYCGCDEPKELSKQRAGKIRNGTAGYSCRTCRETLTLRRLVPKKLTITEVTHEPVRMAARSARTATNEQPAPKRAKADIVREAIATVRANGITMEALLANGPAMQVIAEKSGLTQANARSSVKYNWHKV